MKFLKLVFLLTTALGQASMAQDVPTCSLSDKAIYWKGIGDFNKLPQQVTQLTQTVASKISTLNGAIKKNMNAIATIEKFQAAQFCPSFETEISAPLKRLYDQTSNNGFYYGEVYETLKKTISPMDILTKHHNFPVCLHRYAEKTDMDLAQLAGEIGSGSINDLTILIGRLCNERRDLLSHPEAKQIVQGYLSSVYLLQEASIKRLTEFKLSALPK